MPKLPLHKLEDTNTLDVKSNQSVSDLQASTPPHLQQAISVPYPGGGEASEAVGEEHWQVVSKASLPFLRPSGLPPVYGRSNHWKMPPSTFQKTKISDCSLVCNAAHYDYPSLPPSHVWHPTQVTRGNHLEARSIYACWLARVKVPRQAHISRSFDILQHISIFLLPLGSVFALTTPSSQCRPTAIRIAITSTAQRCGFYQYPPCCLCFVHR